MKFIMFLILFAVQMHLPTNLCCAMDSGKVQPRRLISDFSSREWNTFCAAQDIADATLQEALLLKDHEFYCKDNRVSDVNPVRCIGDGLKIIIRKFLPVAVITKWGTYTFITDSLGTNEQRKSIAAKVLVGLHLVNTHPDIDMPVCRFGNIELPLVKEPCAPQLHDNKRKLEEWRLLRLHRQSMMNTQLPRARL